MKRRNRKRYMLNLLSLALLAIALYLNFIKKDTTDFSTIVEDAKQTGAENSKTSANIPAIHTAQTFVLK
ncbi:MAG: hypothetical protein EOO10_19360 [Chitinophagaceae bacterium]|nr:MAG: hypothetical protein EOO10_19360 [Chitinophagaceae bacterium]